MKVKSKKNVKRWQRHGSSVSNPQEKRFREAAKNRFFHKPSGVSALTVEAVQKHENAESDKLDLDNTDAKTFNTWATNWTECTNITFSRVHRLWHSNSAQHREILAVLAAVTEVIKEQGGQESETEYFAALMTTLETVETEESATAVAYLLSLVIKRVPAPVLKSRFSQVSKKLLDAIAAHAEKETTSLFKSLLLCVACVLRVQEAAVWSQSSTQHVYNCLLTFTTHKKPRVRKAAQQAVKIVLKGSLFMTQPDAPSHHPAAALTAKFCVQIIESQGGASEAVDTLHVLGLLQDVIATFPQKSVKSACETILRVMTVSNPMVISSGMAALYGLFSNHPSASSLPVDLNAQIIIALHDYQPSENDNQRMPAWLAVMEQAHLNLARLDEQLCVRHLTKLFSVGMTCLLSERQDVAKSATKAMTILLQECIGAHADSLASQIKNSDASQTSVHKIIRALEAGLSYQFHATWDLVLQLLAVALEVFGKVCPTLLKQCLSSMADLRETAHFSYKAEVDAAVGKAVRSMGPRLVLDAIPLKITGQEDDPDLTRSWLMPVLRDNVSDTELSFFSSYFLPLAARFRQKSMELAGQSRTAAAKTYEALQTQVWSMLKGFCTRPTDIAKSFKGVAKVLGTALNERPDLQMDVLAALRTVVTHSKNNEADKQAVAQFTKNFLPILFNLFTKDPDNAHDNHRLAVLETVKVYITIADSELVLSFLDKCLSKMEETDVTAFRKIALKDLAIVMVPYADAPRLKKLYALAVSSVEASDKSVQKKAYRILEEVCACPSEYCRDFLSTHLEELQKLLLSSLSASAPSTKAPRLRCLIHILQQLSEPQSSFIKAVMPEALLCTKVVGERARAAAYTLVIEIAKALIRWNPDKTEQEVLSEYVSLLLAGLAGSPQMISGTLLALTRVLYQYKEKLSGQVLSSLIQSVCLLLTSKNREVVKAALAFVKVLLGAYQPEILSAHLSELVAGLAAMRTDCKNHCRMKTKQIYAKLIKKFGYETVHGMTPESVHKLLTNIRKTQEREKRLKNKKDENASESEDEDEAVPKTRPETIDELLQDSDLEESEETKGKAAKTARQKATQRRAWLKEESEDITDFMDTSGAAKKVLASQPSSKSEKAKGSSKDAGFKVAADGRLIITEPKDDKGEKMDSDQEDDLDDLLTALEGGSDKKRRKRLRAAREHEDDDEPAPKYKAGGSGIHRPLDKKPADHGKDYRAKKAGGDIKKKGKPDPYAYVPLDFKQLNKRKQAKLKGQFAGLVKGARKGALKAKKGKVKRV
ncbi:hypothetical protein BaRGS_00029600 [Batillaria attramentaria]|uniref:Ribosomal RNA-processing protein 12-like conserved domain-containing protein n=1 Tax=Batillaria attramentaria TaxID=370345 RepID=A0ABD0JWT1_9CAEN